MEEFDWSDFIGLAGVFITLTAYVLLQSKWMSVEDLTYSVVNILGSGMILYSLYYQWNTAAFIIEAAWLMISVYGTLRVVTRRAARRLI